MATEKKIDHGMVDQDHLMISIEKSLIEYLVRKKPYTN